MTIWYGGDYNPEQWDRAVWDEDVQLMQSAGVNMATVGVFSWSRLEPRRGDFDFEWLDVVIDKLHAAGVRVDLATATASPPPWLTAQHPEVLPVDEFGVRLSPGSRQHYCPSSPTYRERAAILVSRLVERYVDHPAVEMWHINNEYGGHVSRCYCDVSARAFRSWLAAKYETIENLNSAWGGAFWSQLYGSFDEILPPRAAPTFINPSQLVDFDRFSSDELIECFRLEKQVIRSSSALPITTNFMGFFKGADYWKWASELDVVSDDLYPDPADPSSVARAAMIRDLMRSLGAGAPWLLMEQSTSAINWRSQNVAKAPGQMRAWSYQALARGANGILFFQWRQSRAGAERFHSAMIPHSGTETRVWREVEALGRELRALTSSSAIASSPQAGQVAIMFDWDSWWAIEQQALPTQINYIDVLFTWHRSLTASGHLVDFVPPGRDLSGYRLVVVPSLFVATDRTLSELNTFAAGGGTLVVAYATAIVDENQHIRLDGYLGQLQETLGLRIDEITPPPTAGFDLLLEGSVVNGSGRAGQWVDELTVEGADVVASFSEGDFHGRPAITRNNVGGGAWYVATQLSDDALDALIRAITADSDVNPEWPDKPRDVEMVRRGDTVFVINHGDAPFPVPVLGIDLLTGGETESLSLGRHQIAVIVDGLDLQP